ncbi:MAG TPA: S-methyl-5-thioribose-1-phosphate isomerase [Candidatus Limnocylindrales bacterium]|jgi:methylthioribose-1-phosphate isomerase|nr:S-methyl-5-thioribose-1-phosphate isomerase [Candidatus Limnocylindrales bacterium]
MTDDPPSTPAQAAEPDADGAPTTAEFDPDRRQFFRRFAGELLTGAGTVVGAVTELRDRSAAEASALLGQPSSNGAAPSAGSLAAATPSSSAAQRIAPEEPPAGFRTPFRFESDDVLLVIDQRRLPDQLVEVHVRTANDAARAIHDMVVRGAPAIGQVAAIGLALTAKRAAKAQPHARRAILDGAATILRDSRPTAVNLGWAVDRLLARYDEIGKLSEHGHEIAAALWAEAMAIVDEATEDHGRLAEAGQAILPAVTGRPLRVLTHCNTGPLACGQFGTALGIVQAAHAAERPLHVWVDETRPYLQGARLTAWELKQAGVEHTLIPDMAAGPLMAEGQVDVVIVGADRIAANGDTANKLGTFTLAVLAQRHGIPFVVAAPLSSVDLATPTGTGIPIEDRPASEVTEIRGVRIAPEGTAVRNPSFDVTPADLISAIVTEEGVLRAPFDRSLAEAMARRDARRLPRQPYSLEPAKPVGAAF